MKSRQANVICSDDEDDPFAERAMNPVLRTEEKILEALRGQLQVGVLSLQDYEKAASGAVKVLSPDEADLIHRPGTTLRLVFSNERRQLKAGLISQEEFVRMRKAAVGAISGSPKVSSKVSPRANVSSPLIPRISPRKSGRKALLSPSSSDRASSDKTPNTYVPFVSGPSKTIGRQTALQKRGVAEAISLDLEARIIEITQKERRTRVGRTKFRAAYRIELRGKGGLVFSVIRRFGEFFDLRVSLKQVFPEFAFPELPSKSGFDNLDHQMIERVSHSLNAILEIVCKNSILVRSREFVKFIDPKTNPNLGSISNDAILKSGFVRFRKLPSAAFRRAWAVLTRDVLYFFPNDRELKMEPISSVPINLCKIDITRNECIEIHRFTQSRKILIRPDDLNELILWISTLKENHSAGVHKRILPLVSLEQSVKRASEYSEAVRKATAMTLTMKKIYYEADRENYNILYGTGGVLKAATATKLVECLLNNRLFRPHDVVNFIFTFHSVLSSLDLLDQLMGYFKRAPGELRSPRMKSSTVLSSTALRVVSILQKWYALSPGDFSKDPLLLASLRDFCETNNLVSLVFKVNAVQKTKIPTLPMTPSTTARSRPRSNSTGSFSDSMSSASPTPVTARRAKVEVDASGTVRLTSKMSSKRKMIPSFQNNESETASPARGRHRRQNSTEKSTSMNKSAANCIQTPILPYGFPKMAWDLFSLTPVEIARQLALFHFGDFQRCEPSEFLNQNWSKESKLAHSPNIVALIGRFNNLSGIVSTTIVKCREAVDRAGVISFFVQIAEHAFEHNDFSSTMALLSGLSNSAVYRLSRTWALFSARFPAHDATFARLTKQMSSDRNSVELRTRLRQCNPPLVPYLGLFLQDLTFVDEGNPDFISLSGSSVTLVNWDKRAKIAGLIQTIRLFQTVQYSFVCLPQVQAYFERFAPLSSEKLYSRSLVLEPRV